MPAKITVLPTPLTEAEDEMPIHYEQTLKGDLARMLRQIARDAFKHEPTPRELGNYARSLLISTILARAEQLHSRPWSIDEYHPLS
jgi:hypothetical protein